MFYKCPHCPDPPGKYFNTKDKLNKHIKRVHQGQPAKPGSGIENPAPQPKPGATPEPKPSPTPGQFEVKKPEPKKKEKAEKQGYFCQTCGYEPIEKGTPNCPSCGESLNWEGVQ